MHPIDMKKMLNACQQTMMDFMAKNKKKAIEFAKDRIRQVSKGKNLPYNVLRL